VFSVGALIIIVRSLRRGVFVTDSLLIERRLFVTRLLPWSSLHDVHFATPRRVCAEVDGRSVHVDAPPPRTGTPFKVAVESAMAHTNVTHNRRDQKQYPPRGRRWIAYALLASSAALLTGILVIENAVRDRDAYRLRAARDTPGVAEVTGSHIDEDDSGETSTYTTRVDIRFHIGERTVQTQVHRPGQWTYAPIDIVYDAQHPRDADFSNRINRKANDTSVSLRLVVGPILAVLGVLGCLAFGTIVLANTVRSRGIHHLEPLDAPALL
jgi:hypothetical protein